MARTLQGQQRRHRELYNQETDCSTEVSNIPSLRNCSASVNDKGVILSYDSLRCRLRNASREDAILRVRSQTSPSGRCHQAGCRSRRETRRFGALENMATSLGPVSSWIAPMVQQVMKRDTVGAKPTPIGGTARLDKAVDVLHHVESQLSPVALEASNRS